MTDVNRKPWLTASEQIDRLKSRGVHFSLMSEDDARVYLEKNSNYFRLHAYRLGFPKVEEGTRKGEYANLDFKMLVDFRLSSCSFVMKCCRLRSMLDFLKELQASFDEAFAKRFKLRRVFRQIAANCSFRLDEDR